MTQERIDTIKREAVEKYGKFKGFFVACKMVLREAWNTGYERGTQVQGESNILDEMYAENPNKFGGLTPNRIRNINRESTEQHGKFFGWFVAFWTGFKESFVASYERAQQERLERVNSIEFIRKGGEEKDD